jgi:hypothetical protein
LRAFRLEHGAGLAKAYSSLPQMRSKLDAVVGVHKKVEKAEVFSRQGVQSMSRCSRCTAWRALHRRFRGSDRCIRSSGRVSSLAIVSQELIGCFVQSRLRHSH